MKNHLSELFSSSGERASNPDKREMLERCCSELTERLKDIRACFDMAEDDDAIDALIYEENAVLCRLAQLYKTAKAEGITLEHFERGSR